MARLLDGPFISAQVWCIQPEKKRKRGGEGKSSRSSLEP